MAMSKMDNNLKPWNLGCVMILMEFAFAFLSVRYYHVYGMFNDAWIILLGPYGMFARMHLVKLRPHCAMSVCIGLTLFLVALVIGLCCRKHEKDAVVLWGLLLLLLFVWQCVGVGWWLMGQ